MRVMVALENRFVKTQNGNIYSTTVCDYNFWKRYLQVFDEVIVFARMADILKEKLNKPTANGSGLRFFRLPYYVGLRQYLEQHRKIKTAMKCVTDEADVFILRVPGRISTLLWYRLTKENIPYGVEVEGSSVDYVETSGTNFLLKSILRRVGPGNQRKQCNNAKVISYITKNYLQSLYPPGGWSTYFSDVDLMDEAIIDEHRYQKRFVSLRNTLSGQRPFRICHAGTMAALYKAQDVLIEAISICHKKGFNVELTLLGDGSYRDCFEDKAKKLGINEHIRWLGFLPPGAPVRKELDKADLFILPSLTEGQGRVLLEAMARGLPSLGSNVGGIPELLDAGDLVPPGDAEALAEKIEEVICDEKRLTEMSKRNLDTAKKFRVEELNPRRIEFYKKVAELSKD